MIRQCFLLTEVSSYSELCKEINIITVYTGKHIVKADYQFWESRFVYGVVSPRNLFNRSPGSHSCGCLFITRSISVFSCPDVLLSTQYLSHSMMNLEFHIKTFTRKLESVSAKLFYEQNSSKSAIKLISESLIKYDNEVWSSASHSAFSALQHLALQIV